MLAPHSIYFFFFFEVILGYGVTGEIVQRVSVHYSSLMLTFYLTIIQLPNTGFKNGLKRCACGYKIRYKTINQELASFFC